MKRLFLFVLLAAASFTVNAQDVKTAKKLYDAKDYVKAKEAIDQTLATEKGTKDWEAWFVKGKIYSALAANEATKNLVPDARMQAFDALKKSLEMNNPLATLMLTQDGFKPIFSLYEGYYNDGATDFNAEKYAEAFENYKNANEVGQYIHKNGWALSALDTALVFMTGASANNAKKLDDAAFYYAKLVDAGVTNKDYTPAYKFLIYYYNEKGDEANFNKYVELGKKAFPDDRYYDDVEIEALEKKGDKDAVIKKYEEVLAKDPNDYENNFYYAATLFNTVYRDEVTGPKRDEMISKLEKAFAKCIELKPDEPDAYLELGKSHYNQAVDFKDQADQIKPTAGKPLTADQQAAKKDLKAKAEKKINDAIPYLEKSFSLMDAIPDKKIGQKAKERSIAILLRDSYSFIDKMDKSKYYDDIIDKLK